MKNPQECQYNIMRKLAQLPERIVVGHTHENLAEFILHELIDPACFPCTKAAFFVDNPDFDCLKGVAGICTGERFCSANVWEACDQFTEHMKEASFNAQVRSIAAGSSLRAGTAWDASASHLACTLALSKHQLAVFPLKHGNTGLLLFESYEMPDEIRECMNAGVALLGLCPIF